MYLLLFYVLHYLEIRALTKEKDNLSVLPTFLGLWNPTEGKYNLLHPLGNALQFALRFDDILKIVFLKMY